MSEPWERYQELLRRQKRDLSRSDFLIDSDSSESSEISDNDRGYGDDPQPSTSGIHLNRNNSQASTSGPRPSDGEISDSDISDLSSSFGNEEPAIQHFNEVTKNVNQEFLPVTSLQMPASKRKIADSDSSEPVIKKKKFHDHVMGIGINVIRTHHRQEKKMVFW